MNGPSPLHIAVDQIARFMDGEELTTRVAEAEQAMRGVPGSDIGEVSRQMGLDGPTLTSALMVRRAFGRISDVIHAATIVMTLEKVMEEGEVLVRPPSLGAGNDPGRPFDVETDRRVAEFKAAEWKGADAMRKRTLFADLARLAMEDSGRRKQLFVVGELPRRYLTTTRTSVSRVINRSSQTLRDRMADRYGSLEMSVAEFTATHGSQVEVVNMEDIVPELIRGLSDSR